MYEVVQIFPDGYEQHISICDTVEEAKRDIQEFPAHWRHNGKLEIKKRAENFGGDPEGKLAKALERARKKAKQPRKPLKIERLKAESFGAEDGYECSHCGSHELRYVVYDNSENNGFFCMNCGDSPCGINEIDDKPCTCDMMEYGQYTWLGEMPRTQFPPFYDAKTVNSFKKQEQDKENERLRIVGSKKKLDAIRKAESFEASRYSVSLIEEEGLPDYYPHLTPEYTIVQGRGRYRFNRYGSDGMTYQQYRFATKDAAIEWLCYQPHTYIWVKPNQPQYDFPPNTHPSLIKKWYKSESFRVENRSLAKKSWDTLNNVETAVGTVGLAHMIGLGAIIGGGFAFLKGRKSNSKTEQ